MSSPSSVGETRSLTSRVLLTIMTVGGLGFVVKGIAAVKEIVVARTFGVGDAVDAYLMGYALPGFAIVVAVHALHPALVPLAVATRRREGRESETGLLSSTLGWSLLLLMVAAGLLILAAPWLLQVLAAGFPSEKIALTVRLMWLMSAMIIFSGVSMIATSSLHVEEKFKFAALVPILTPVSVLVFILTSADRLGIFAIAIGMVTGSFLEALLLLLRSWSIRGVYRPSLQTTHPSLKLVLRRYLPVVGSYGLMSGTGLIDQAMSATLAAGSVSALSYGSRLVLVGMGPIKIAVDRVAIPFFSRMVEDRVWSRLRRMVHLYLGIIFAASAPVVLVLWFYSKPIVELVFEGGAFTDADTIVVAAVQAMYGLQIPFFIGVSILISLLFSLGANDKHLWLAFLSLCGNVILNYILMKTMGVVGIALSTSIMAVVYFVATGIVVERALAKRENVS